MKRLFDMFLATIIIITFMPIGIIIVIILLFTGEGEVFYKQSRIGLHGETFSLIKFVTMVKNSPNLGAGDITLKDDPRVLPIGKILRKTKINEFPQFINVLLGDMSIVGPRPLVINQFNMIPNNYKKIIIMLKPGITGIGSIVFRDEEKYLQSDLNDSNNFYKSEIVPFKASLECWYHDNSSIFVDILLVIITIIMVFIPNMNLHNHCFYGLPKHRLFNRG